MSKFLGNVESIDQFGVECGKEIVLYVMRLGVRQADAADVLQMTLVAAWRGRHTYSGRGSVRAWLFGIARLQALQFLRATASGRRDVPSDDVAESAQFSGDDFADGLADRSALRIAIESLPADQREAVVLAFLFGMPMAEIAQVQVVPLGTVKSRINTARHKLRSLLAGSFPERVGGVADGKAVHGT